MDNGKFKNVILLLISIIHFPFSLISTISLSNPPSV